MFGPDHLAGLRPESDYQAWVLAAAGRGPSGSSPAQAPGRGWGDGGWGADDPAPPFFVMSEPRPWIRSNCSAPDRLAGLHPPRVAGPGPGAGGPPRGGRAAMDPLQCEDPERRDEDPQGVPGHGDIVIFTR